MGRRMSSALRSRACALAFAFVIGVLAFAVTIPAADAVPNPNPVQPAAMTVTVVLDKSSYLSGDTNAVIVLSGTTSATFFSFRTPNPSSRSYTFHVTATDRGNSTQAQATISQAAGFVLGLSFDKTSYAAGDTVHVRLTLTARGAASLPSQFRWGLSSASASVSSITTGPTADLSLTIPQGTGNGGLLVCANELNTGAGAFQTVQVGSAESFWATQVGGITVFALILGVLF